MSQLSTFGISKNIYFKYVQALYQTLLLSMNFGQKKQKKKIATLLLFVITSQTLTCVHCFLPVPPTSHPNPCPEAFAKADTPLRCPQLFPS